MSHTVIGVQSSVMGYRLGLFPCRCPGDILRSMPIYEYTCKSCSHQFETLVRTGHTPVCVACGSADLERLFSLPAVKSEDTHARALGAAKRRDKAEAKDKAHEQLKYERSHND